MYWGTEGYNIKIDVEASKPENILDKHTYYLGFP